MSLKLEMLDFMSKLQNAIDVFNIDPDESEFCDTPYVVEKLVASLMVANAAFQVLKLSEDLMYGEISPAVFMSKWKEHTENRQINVIGDEVKDLLKKTGKRGE